MTAAPRVSVVVPLYNGARFIAETIESVLAQTFDDLELVIVDDGSGDGGDDIARTWARAHPDTVRVIAHPGRANRGAAASRNVGIAAAPSIADIDGDGRLEIVVTTIDHGIDVYRVPRSDARHLPWPTGRGAMTRAGRPG